MKQQKTGTKITRNKDIVIQKIQEGLSIDEIMGLLKLSKYVIRKIAKNENLEFLKTPINKNRKTERNAEMLKMLNSGISYTIIGKKFNISKSRVQEIAKLNGIKRWEIGRKECKEKIEKINHDIQNGVVYNDLLLKYDLDNNLINKLRYHGLKPITTTYRTNRNKTIVDEYKMKTAKKVLDTDIEVLNDPQRIQTIGSVYSISSAAGYKKYPNIGKKCLGGSQETKEVLGFILTRRNIDKKSFKKISDELNQNKMVTIGGLPFTSHNVRFKYLSQYKSKK